MNIVLIAGHLDLAATTIADAKELFVAAADPAVAANSVAIDRITGKLASLVFGDTGTQLEITSISDAAGTISDWVTDPTQTVKIVIGDADPSGSRSYAATSDLAIVGNTRAGTLDLATPALAAAISGAFGRPPRGVSQRFVAHVRRTEANGHSETLAMISIQIVCGVFAT
jgi:hypothetical protein